MAPMIVRNARHTIFSHVFHEREKPFLAPAHAMRYLQHGFHLPLRTDVHHAYAQPVAMGRKFQNILHVMLVFHIIFQKSCSRHSTFEASLRLIGKNNLIYRTTEI